VESPPLPATRPDQLFYSRRVVLRSQTGVAHRHLYCTMSDPLRTSLSLCSRLYQSRRERVPVAASRVVRQFACRLEPVAEFEPRSPFGLGNKIPFRRLCVLMQHAAFGSECRLLWGGLIETRRQFLTGSGRKRHEALKSGVSFSFVMMARSIATGIMFSCRMAS